MIYYTFEVKLQMKKNKRVKRRKNYEQEKENKRRI